MLYIIGTPIGNLSDISFRAIETLKSVDVILCEDTRVSRKLLNHYEISKPTISLHQHTTDDKTKSLLEKYENIAYISDAGTPGISDPGGKLVELAVEADHEIVTIPGASAIISALSVSGLPTDKFTFLGFMPRRGQTKVLEFIQNAQYTTCFYESPHRILKTLEALKPFVSSERKVVIGRELTKKFETVYRGSLEDVLEQVKPKGEFVVIIEKVKK
jgi:16S rRNA (cytidine1402-2'-O)-methyltransferase